MDSNKGGGPVEVDSAAAWVRLSVVVLIGTIGAVGMWSGVVALPAVQAEFGVARAEASLPYTLTLIGFALGSVLTGRLSDRFGVAWAVIISTLLLSIGYVLAGAATRNLWQFAAIYGVLIGVGSSVSFGPLMADLSHWFQRRRGIAVSLASCGNYLAGVLWPPVLQHFIHIAGWRTTHIGVGIICAAMITPLAWRLRHTPVTNEPAAIPGLISSRARLGMPPKLLQAMLCIAALACCVAMAMPQVHIVAYCGDLGYGLAHGAQMLSLMLGCGILSRVVSGFVADRIGAVATLLIGSTLQGFSLMLYLRFDGLNSLYVISAIFGLFQGGIVPMYAIIVSEHFPPSETGGRIGMVMMTSLLGMALGGWLSGAIFDWTGSYQAAFAGGLLFNLLNVMIIATLVWRWRARLAYA